MNRPSNNKSPLPAGAWRIILAAVLVALALARHAAAADCGCVQACDCVVVRQPPQSWIFEPGRYTHDPATGNRVAQYMRGPAIEPLGRSS